MSDSCRLWKSGAYVATMSHGLTAPVFHKPDGRAQRIWHPRFSFRENRA
jgi:hypothetical protein